ncbi:TRAP transporter small permease [Fulvimarina sp. MAC3]|uniref:TRAP transporter small permease n=1 Tax=Fulvimarina sp. MAC3 TaxID=3148887 RepID=UPI0031FE251D
MTLRSAFQKADHYLTLAVMTTASIALAIAVASGFWQVVSRFLIESPSTWSEALTRLSLIWMVLLGLSGTTRQGALVAIDLARDVSRGRVLRGLQAMVLVSCLLLFAMMFWFGIEVTQRVQFQQMAGLWISMSWGYAAIPVGAIFGAVGAISQFLNPVREEVPL